MELTVGFMQRPLLYSKMPTKKSQTMGLLAAVKAIIALAAFSAIISS